MFQYKITAYVNGNRTETVVSARDTISAKKLFEAQYSGCKITQLFVTRIA